LILVFIFSNNLSGNQLALRYSGETNSTLEGSREKDLTVLTTGRWDILVTDWNIFQDHFMTGVGPGESKGIRPQYGYPAIAAHTEISRLFSEHGVGGFIIVLALFSFPFYWVRKQRSNFSKALTAALLMVSIGTMFHAAMRTNTTTVCFALACLPLIKSVSRGKEENV
jgi:O-antigen ligase